ncbi:MAG: hypothetical protein ABSD92_11420 [Candidatus Bathyarchaeia archaeon]
MHNRPLLSMMRGHALLQGRRQIAMEDLPVILDVALSSAPWDRILAFAYVLSKDKVNATELEKNLKCSRGKALRTMQTLKLLDLVNLSDHSRIVTNSGEQFAYEMHLKPEFKWFQSAEFRALWRQKPAYPDVLVQIKEAEPREIENFVHLLGHQQTCRLQQAPSSPSWDCI